MKDYIKTHKEVRHENKESTQPIAEKVHSKEESDLYSKVVKNAIDNAK